MCWKQTEPMLLIIMHVRFTGIVMNELDTSKNNHNNIDNNNNNKYANRNEQQPEKR